MTSSSVELSVAAFALVRGMVRVVQAAMLGAILNNLLLVSLRTPFLFICQSLLPSVVNTALTSLLDDGY